LPIITNKQLFKINSGSKHSLKVFFEKKGPKIRHDFWVAWMVC